MTQGLFANLDELIALRRLVCKTKDKRLVLASQPGMRRSRWLGRGMDVAEIRNYQAGDEVRHMEWRVTARTGRPHVKVYQEERERPIVLCVDFNPSMYFGTRVAFKSVVAARLAGLIAWSGALSGERVGGLIFNGATHTELEPKSRNAGVLPLLAHLSNYTKQYSKQDKVPPNPKGFSEVLMRLKRVVRPGSLVIFISDFYRLELDSQLLMRALLRHNQVIAYHVCDAFEQGLPNAGAYPITDGNHSYFLDLNDSKTQHVFQESCTNRLQQVSDYFKSLQIASFKVFSDTDLMNLLRTSLSFGGKYG